MVDTLAMIAAERWYELKAQAEAWTHVDDTTWRVRAELASVRHGPVCDAVVTARRAIRQRWADAPHYVRLAVRALGSIGALPLARELLGAAESYDHGAGAYALVHAQLVDGDWRGRSHRTHAAFVALERGDVDAARRGFEAAAEQSDQVDRAEALHMLAALSRQAGDFTAARRAHRAAHDHRPESDAGPRLALEAALDAWLSGQRVAAVSELREVRALKAVDRSPRAWAARRAERLLQEFERDPNAVCEWRRSELGNTRASVGATAGVLEVIARWLQRGTPAVPEGHERLAHLRRILAGTCVESLRVQATLTAVRAAVQQGALVVLEEERPIGHALTLVAGYDEHTELLAFREPHGWGCELALWKERARALETLSFSALVVLGDGEQASERRRALEARGVVHDALFDALDACEVDQHGDAPPFAETLAIARQVLEGNPGCKLARKRGGDALLHGYRIGRVSDEDLLGWIAAAREHESTAEWPQQLYAQWLSSEQRPGEAALAWAAARDADPLDYRNALGEARALLELQQVEWAEPLLREASTLHGSDVQIAAWLARAALARDALELADSCASVCTALAPEDCNAWSVRASVLEADGRLDEAIEAFQRAAALPGGDEPYLTLRHARRCAAAGRFSKAQECLAPLITHGAKPNDEVLPLALLVQARLAVSQGDLEGAYVVVARAIERCGPRSELLEVLITLLTLTSRDEQAFAARWTSTVEPHVDHQSRTWSEVLVALSSAGRHNLAKARLALLPEFAESNAERTWIEARTWLYSGEYESGPLLQQLAQVVEAFPAFEAPRILSALLLAETEPERALAVTRAESSSGMVAASWFAQARAQQRLGRVSEADALHDRLGQLPGSLVAHAAAFLCGANQSAHAAELLQLALAAQPDDADLRRQQVEVAWQRAATEEAAAVLRELHQRGESCESRVACRVALAAGDWELLGGVASRGLRGLLDSRIEGDPWLFEAAIAAASLALGDPQPRARLLEQAGRHVRALALLAHVETRLASASRPALSRLREVTDLADHLLQRAEVL